MRDKFLSFKQRKLLYFIICISMLAASIVATLFFAYDSIVIDQEFVENELGVSLASSASEFHYVYCNDRNPVEILPTTNAHYYLYAFNYSYSQLPELIDSLRLVDGTDIAETAFEELHHYSPCIDEINVPMAYDEIYLPFTLERNLLLIYVENHSLGRVYVLICEGWCPHV